MKHKQFNCEVIKISEPDKAKKVFRFKASTPDVDRTDDIIELAGWDTKNWEKNPVILWGHKSGELPIGRGVQVIKNYEKQALEIDVEFASDENPFAATVEKLTDKGYIKAVSVGFKPIKAEERDDVEDSDSWWPPMRFIEQELLELSIVSVPANPHALLVTNSADRDLMLQKGLALGMIDQVKFSEKVSGDEIEAFMREHDLAGFVPMTFPDGKNPTKDQVFVKKNTDEPETFRWITAGLDAQVRCSKRVATGGVVPIPTTYSISTGFDSASFIKYWDSTANSFNTGIISLKDAITDVQKSQHQELKILIAELRDTTKAIASLYEVVDAPKETVTPADKAAEGMSEQWLKEIRDSVEEAKTVLTHKE